MMNTLERFSLAEEAKTILVQMAIDGTLPMDMNELDMDGILTKADQNLSQDENHIRLEMYNKFVEYISYESIEDANEQLDTILNHPNQNDCWTDLEGITPIQSLVYSSMTVTDLLDTIS